MGQFTGPFGIGTPAYLGPQTPWGIAPYGGQGFGMQTFPQLPFAQTLNPLTAGGFGGGPYGLATPPLQQIVSLLQIVPQQLQQVQLLQQHQLAQLQQLLQLVPLQLQQIQQLVQTMQAVHTPFPQSLQQWQPFGAGISGPLGLGLGPQAFGGQATSHVM
jgi:hypothetical protein